MQHFDAVIVGSGINGLVAAAEVSSAGWKIALVKQEGLPHG